MNTIEKLKEYNGNLFVSILDDELQSEVIEWVENFCQESFVADDEKDKAVSDAMNSRICDIIQTMEMES